MIGFVPEVAVKKHLNEKKLYIYIYIYIHILNGPTPQGKCELLG